MYLISLMLQKRNRYHLWKSSDLLKKLNRNGNQNQNVKYANIMYSGSLMKNLMS